MDEIGFSAGLGLAMETENVASIGTRSSLALHAWEQAINHYPELWVRDLEVCGTESDKRQAVTMDAV